MRPLNTCCFCCKLETGAYVFATLGLIVELLLAVLLSFQLAGSFEIPELIVSPLEVIVMIPLTITYVSLIIGTKKKRHSFILPFLIIFPLCMVLDVIGYIWLLMNDDNHDKFAIMDVCVFVFGTAFSIYCWYCVYSLYLRLKNLKNITGAYRGYEIYENGDTVTVNVSAENKV